MVEKHDEVVDVAFPYFGGIEHDHYNHVEFKDILKHKLGTRKVQLADGSEVAW